MSRHPAVTRLPGPAPLAPTQGTLALDLQPRLEPPESTVGREIAGDVLPIDGRARRELERWCRRYVQAAVEIVGGDRPVSQLVRWTDPAVHADLARRAQVVARAGVHHAGLGQGRRPVVRPSVVSVHACFVGPTVAEAGVHVRYGERSRAVAARFEQQEGRWVCCALEFA